MKTSTCLLSIALAFAGLRSFGAPQDRTAQPNIVIILPEKDLR